MQFSPARFVLVTLTVTPSPFDLAIGANEDPVVIQFGSQSITRARVDDRFQVAVRLLAYRQGISLTDQDPSVIRSLREQYLEKYATDLVLLQEAERRQLLVTETQVDEALGELPVDEVDDALLRRIVHDEQTIELLTEAMLKEIRIPPGDVVTMHHDVKDNLATPEEVCVRHIQVDSVDAANDIRESLEKGADFAKLAAELSTDAASAGNGGDLGCFERGHAASRSEFEEAAFAALEGQIAGPIPSSLGYHVLVVYEHKMPRAPTLNEAYAQIERELALEQLPERLSTLVSESGISVRPESFRVSTE